MTDDKKKAYADQQRIKRLALNLRVIRTSLGMSEQELAEKAGYRSGTTITAIENGSTEPSYEKVKDLANALGVSIGQLRGLGKIETTEEGWPKLTEAERTAHFIFGPILKSLDADGIRYLIDTGLLVCRAKGVVPEWKKTEYQTKKAKEGKDE